MTLPETLPSSLPVPRFHDPARVGEVFLERAALVEECALADRRARDLRPASDDRLRIALFGIDCQVGFCTPGASLFVPGAVDDMRRALAFFYTHVARITGLVFSLDTHRVYQIFHPAFWLDAAGAHPAPFTPITHDDVVSGRFTPIAHRAECLEYTRQLERDGKYVLTIWPYHTLLGGVSHALVPSWMEASIYHAIARRTPTHFETKGMHPMTENYSVLSPEVTELGGDVVGAFNQDLFDLLLSYDRVYVFGEAKSHCVSSTLKDLEQRIAATDPRAVDKFYLLEDAMSPVPAPPLSPLPPHLDFPRLADEAVAHCAAIGMHVVKTTDPIDL